MTKKIQSLQFDSAIALSDYLESNWSLWERGIQSGSTFTDCMTQDECRAILANGGHWEEGAARMQKAALDIHKIPARELDVPELVSAPVGHRPNVGAYMAGSPLSMNRFVPQPQPNKAVKMLVNLTASAGIGHQTLMNRGAAIMGAIDNLQAEGYAVELTVGFFTSAGREGDFHATIKIKDFHDTWNPAAFAFFIAEPSFYRRSLFAVANIEAARDSNSIADALGDSLGSVITKLDNQDYDIEFDAQHLDQGWTADNAAEKAMQKVYDWLERNKADAA